jgi:hypothetical protein
MSSDNIGMASQSSNGPTIRPVTPVDAPQTSQSSAENASHIQDNEEWEDVDPDETYPEWVQIEERDFHMPSASDGIPSCPNYPAPSGFAPSSSTLMPLQAAMFENSSSNQNSASMDNAVRTNQNENPQSCGSTSSTATATIAANCMNSHWGCGVVITELKAANKGLRKAEEDHQKSRQDMYDEFLAQAEENHQQQVRLERSVKQMKGITEAAQGENDKLQKEINKLRKQRDLEEWNRVAASYTARDHIVHIQTLERQSVEKDARIDQLTRELQRESRRKHEAQRQVATYQQELRNEKSRIQRKLPQCTPRLTTMRLKHCATRMNSKNGISSF